MFKQITCLLIVVLVECTLLSSAFAQQGGNGGGGGGTTATYDLTDLLGLPNSYYQSIGEFLSERDEDDNVVIHGRSIAGGTWHSVDWTVDAEGNWSLSDLVDRGTPNSVRGVQARGFNSQGLAVCDTDGAILKDENDEWISPAFVDHPLLGFLELPSPFSRNARVGGINDAGTIVGQYRDANPDPLDPNPYVYRACLWQIDSLGIISGPVALDVDANDFGFAEINNYGVIAARYYGHPVVAWFENGQLRMTTAGSPQLLGGSVQALNDYPPGHPSLTVVGDTSSDATGAYTGHSQAYAWRPWNTTSPVTVLGKLGGYYSIAKDVNSHGVIVGVSDTKRSGLHAFIYQNGKMTDLNSQVDLGGKVLRWAYGINDSGDITGDLKVPRPVSEQHGFLLRPK